MLKIRIFKIVLLSTALLLLVVCLSYARTDHREYKDQKKKECLECHKAAGVMPNHGVFFLKDHRFLAQPANNNCADCHQQSFCIDCHKGGAIEPDAPVRLSLPPFRKSGVRPPELLSLPPVELLLGLPQQDTEQGQHEDQISPGRREHAAI
jgi:hypothetical protein